ncbi:MAG: hypothetical protein JSW63_08875 [Ignavibacterium sp.]|nr:MAG: hypothetical protein JSW63_08875 [Ignavibacterium sp.]
MKKKIPIIVVAIIFSVILWGSISLSEVYYSNIEIPLKLIDFPKNYTLSSEVPKKMTIKVKGEGWKLFSLNVGQDVSYNVSVNNDSGFINVNLIDYLTDNRWVISELEVIDINPGSISFSVERRIEKKIPVVANLNLDFKAGYGLATDITLSPDSVLVNGPVSVISSLKELPTKEIILSSLDKKTVEKIEFIDLPGTNYGTDFVTITFDIQRIVDKQFDEINVEVLDVPPDRDVVLLPNKVSFGVRGGIDILGKLDKAQFEAFVFYRHVVLDTLGNVTPQVRLPENTNLLYLKPERLRYVIKKFR